MTDESPLVVAASGLGSSGFRDVADAAERRGWEFTALAALSLTAGSGRRLQVLGRCDAADLYVKLHRRPCAVLAFEDVHVRTQPASALRDDRVVPLRAFCRYKSYFAHLRANRAAAVWADQFAAWIGAVACEGHNDCRCLPFHVFAAGATYDLERPEERRRFERDHRRLRVRRDRRDREWSPARLGARHGREPMTIAGFRLEDGFHWDVKPQGSKKIATADAVWTVKNYLNVYPDGASRLGDRCYLDWTRDQSARADTQERSRQGDR